MADISVSGTTTTAAESNHANHPTDRKKANRTAGHEPSTPAKQPGANATESEKDRNYFPSAAAADSAKSPAAAKPAAANATAPTAKATAAKEPEPNEVYFLFRVVLLCRF